MLIRTIRIALFIIDIFYRSFHLSNPWPTSEIDLNSWTILKRLFILSRAAVIKLRVWVLQREKNISRKWSENGGHFSKISTAWHCPPPNFLFSRVVVSSLSPFLLLSLSLSHFVPPCTYAGHVRNSCELRLVCVVQQKAGSHWTPRFYYVYVMENEGMEVD